LAYAQHLKFAAQHPAMARVAPFAVFVALLGLASLLERIAAVDADGLRWLQLARGGAAALLLAFFWRRYLELHASARCSPLEWLLAVAGGLVVFALWIQLDRGWAVLGSAGAGFDPAGPDGRIDPLLAGLRLASLALVVPVMEELFWRSFFLRWLQRQDFLSLEPERVTFKISLFTAVAFALEHNLWFAGFLAGLAYNWLYIRTGRLWVPIVAHAVTNGLLGVWVISTRSWQFW